MPDISLGEASAARPPAVPSPATRPPAANPPAAGPAPDSARPAGERTPATRADAPDPARPAQAPDAVRGMVLFATIVATLYFGREVLIPVTLALLLAFILAPLVELLRRARLGRVLPVVLAVLFALGLIVAIGGVIGSQISQLSTDLPRYAATVEKKVSTVRDYTIGRLSRLADGVGMRGSLVPGDAPAAGPREGTSPGTSEPRASAESRPVPAPAAAAPAQESVSPLEMARRYLSTILSPLATLGIVIVVAIFALLQREDLRDRLIRLLGSDDLHRATAAMDDGARRLSRYFLTQLCINTVFGAVIGTGLYFVGVPSPVLWGILSGLLRFIPYVGAFLAAGLPMALAGAVDPGWSMVLWTAGLFLVVESATGQIIEPMIYGHSTGLSPFSVVVAAIFWSWVWGPIGLILSTPLTLILVVMGRHIPKLEFLDVMLGDRPALTPVESFYQRILAGDADEAQDQAELILKDRSLSTYYDEVALKGLQLAANDARKGVLDARQLDRVKETVKALVEGLREHVDRQPPPVKEDDDGVDPAEAETDPPPHPVPPVVDPVRDNPPERWRTSASVLCLAGRGPLDEAASAMLVQLLEKHGLGARLVSYEAASRDRIGTLDATGVAMACVSYLDISGSPAHLRYLLRRLRQKLPKGAPLLVGLWPSEDPVLKDESLRTAIGADHFASSLEQAVTACVEEARKEGAPEPPR